MAREDKNNLLRLIAWRVTLQSERLARGRAFDDASIGRDPSARDLRRRRQWRPHRTAGPFFASETATTRMSVGDYRTPSPRRARQGRRAGSAATSTAKKRLGSQAKQRARVKTPLSTLLKKASENRVLRDAKLVSMCNHVLASAGLVATVRTPNDVRAVCASTSVLVASFEAVVGEKILGITRRPANVLERARNCDLVVSKLQESVLGTNLEHISGERITQGNLQDIYDLLEILSALGDKWTFATPIKTPASTKHKKTTAMQSYLLSKEKGKDASMKKKLVLDDIAQVEEEVAADQRASGRMEESSSDSETEEAEEVSEIEDEDESSDEGKTLKKKLQALLVNTVEQKRKAAERVSKKKHFEDRARSVPRYLQQGKVPASRQSKQKKQVTFQDTAPAAAAGKAPRGQPKQRHGGKPQFSVKKKPAVTSAASKAKAKSAPNQENETKQDRKDAKNLAEMLLVHDKVTKYVEFYRAVRKLAEMRFSSGELESRLTKVARDSITDSERRMAIMRSSWLRNQRAQTRHQIALEEKRSLAQQRGLLHSARVESIKARRFQNRVEQLRRSNESRYESAEVSAFRDLFNRAIDYEKEVILDRRREASRERRTNAVTRMRDVTLDKERNLREHFEALTEKFKLEILETKKLDKQDDYLKRMYEREERLRIAQERDDAMEVLAPIGDGVSAFD